MAEVLTATEENFESQVLMSELPVLVDFWAAWCGPCRMVAPVVESVAEELEGRIKVAKLNVDENPSVASRYNVMSIPTLILFKDGDEKRRLVGYMPKEHLLEKVKAAL